MGADSLLTDGFALLGAGFAAFAAMIWNRGREFPEPVAVHLLRVADQSATDRCVSRATNAID
jgi:hypothetical protein